MTVRTQRKGLRLATGPSLFGAALGLGLVLSGCQQAPEPKRISGHGAPSRSLSGEARCIRSAGDVDLRYEGILKAFCREVSQHDVVGASLAVAEGGEVRLAVGTGDRCADGTEEVGAKTAFGLGSLSKLVTAAVAFDLSDKHVVGLDDPWRDEPTGPDAAGPDAAGPDAAGPDETQGPTEPTLRQLLNHTGGIRWTLPGPELMDRLMKGPNYFEPGAMWSYSNEGYALAGHALRTATGKDYPALVADLGVDGLSASGEGREMACGHVVAPGNDAPIPTRVRVLASGDEPLVPAGGAVGTASAVANLGLSLLGPRKGMVEGAVPTGEGDSYGLGIRVGETKEGRIAWRHSGNDGHYVADLFMVPSEELVIVVLASGDRPLRGTVSAALSELIDDGMYTAKMQPPEGDLAGDYFVRGFDEPARVHSGAERLTLDLPFLGIKAAVLERMDNGTFELRLPWGPPERLRFVNVGGVMALRGPRFVGFRKSEKTPPTQSEP